MKASSNSPKREHTSRRRFLRGGVGGLALFGLGNALGWFSPRARARGAAFAGRGGAGSPLGKEFEYDVSKFRKTDPKLLLYEPAGEIRSGFKEVRAVAVGNEDRVFVAGDNAIRCFSSGGVLLKEIPLGAPARCLALGPDGMIYVGMKDHVELFAGDGVRQGQWEKLGAGAVITSIAVTASDVFVADAGNRLVLRYGLTGKLVKQIGKKDKARNVPGFIVPSPYFDLAVGADGLLWVANPGQHRVEAYTPEGEFELAWGESALGVAGFCGCCNPVNFAFLPEGRFVTCEKGLVRVKVYSAKGRFAGVVAGPESFPKYIDNPNATQLGIDVAADSKGRVLLADPLNTNVRVYEPKKSGGR